MNISYIIAISFIWFVAVLNLFMHNITKEGKLLVIISAIIFSFLIDNL